MYRGYYILLSATICIILYYLNSIGYTERVLLNAYTFVTRKSFIQKNKARKFSPSITFMGGGQLWMFAIGVGHYVYENYDIDKIKFLASSSGAFAAVPLACGLDPYDWCKKDWGKCIGHFNSRTLGCLFDSKKFYMQLWDEYLPEDAHIKVSGKLFLSVTLFPSMKNLVISDFESREKLMQTIVASLCLPFAFIRDFPVYVNGVGYCIDGGFSNDSPCLDSYTVTASALHHEADIKPAKGPLDKPFNWNKWLKWSGTYSSLNEWFESVDHDDDNMGAGNRNDSKQKYTLNEVQVQDNVSTTSSEISSNEHYNDDGSIDYDHKSRIRAIDIIKVPEYIRVWQVSAIGERAAAKCEDFERHEWRTIRRRGNMRKVKSTSDMGDNAINASSSTGSNTNANANAILNPNQGNSKKAV
jgi:hypothetical protein